MRLPPFALILAGCGAGEAPVPADLEVAEGMVRVPAGEVVLSFTREGRPPAPAPPCDRPAPPGPVHRECHPWESSPLPALEARPVWVEPFWIDLTEVTRAAYAEFLEATGYRPPAVDETWAREAVEHGSWSWQGTRPPAGTGEHPVVLTSWYDATAFCRWRGKRLPTEAEWQLAALGPAAEGRTWPWGDRYDGERLNHGMIEVPHYDASDGHLTTAPVGSYPAGRGPHGLHDAFGNAWEFTADFRRTSWDLLDLREGPAGAPVATAPGPGLYVAVRGGSYYFGLEHNPYDERNRFLPELRRKSSGFRCAR